MRKEPPLTVCSRHARSDGKLRLLCAHRAELFFLTLLLIHFLNNVIDTLLRLVYTNFAMRNNINTH